jgi:hypothetical protein
MATHTIFGKPTPGGDLTAQVVGLAFPSPGAKAERAKFSVPIEYAPAKGDRVKDDAGRWWEVTAVGEMTDAAYSVTCAPAKGK